MEHLKKLKQLIECSHKDKHKEIIKKLISCQKINTFTSTLVNLESLEEKQVQDLIVFLENKLPLNYLKTKPVKIEKDIVNIVVDIDNCIKSGNGNAMEIDTETDIEMKKKSYSYTPYQTLIKKKLKDCGKKLNKHRRVYVEPTYGGNSVNEENEDCSELIESCVVEEHDTDLVENEDVVDVNNNDNDNDNDNDNEDEYKFNENKNEDIDAEDQDQDKDKSLDTKSINGDDYASMNGDEIASIGSMEDIDLSDGDSDCQQGKLDFGSLSITERYEYYKNILETKMSFGEIRINEYNNE